MRPAAALAVLIAATGFAAAATGPRVSQHMVLLQPMEDQLVVRESLIVVNPGTTEFRDPANGAVRIYVPEGGEQTLGVSVIGPSGAASEQKAVRTRQAGIYKVDYALPPGETRFDFAYSLPFKSPGQFSGRILHTDGQANLVVPHGVAVDGDGVEFLGVEPRNQFSIYGLKSSRFTVQLRGAPVPAAPAEDRSSLDQILPRIYDGLYPILGLTFAILALALVLFWRRGSAVASR